MAPETQELVAPRSMGAQVRPELDQQQWAAVLAEERRVFCVAGAGAGKTRVLIERIAHLVENRQVSPYEIVSFTFTRRAAGEMKRRLEGRIGRAAHKVRMGTMHAVCLSYLQRFGEMVGFRPGSLTVYSEFEGDYLLKEVAIDLGFFKTSWEKVPKREIDRVFALYYQEGRAPEEDDPAYPLFQEFHRRCKENNALTYGSILSQFCRLLPLIHGYLQIRHLMVDEVQDIDTLQWRIIRAIEGRCDAALFVGGDIDQSIYEWRGAVPRYLIEHASEFSIYPIETNYRSRAEIVLGANRLIEHNHSRLEKTMRISRSTDTIGSVEVAREEDSQALSEFIARLLDDPGLKPGDVAVLSRKHFLLNKLAEHLAVNKVPFVQIGKTTELIASMEFRIFHAFLNLTQNPYDNFSFLLIRVLIGLTRDQYNEIRLTAAQTGKSHLQAWYESLMANWNEAKDLFACEWSTLAEVAAEVDLLGPWPPQIMSFLADWVEKKPEGTVAEYLDWLATYDLQEEIKEDDNRVHLMTVHAAKGLEWPFVIVAGCNEGILPSKQALGEEAGDELEAERRLMYVAITRARDELLLAVRPERPESRFVREVLLY